ncbi:MAG: Hpt domain-containing protein, partial [Armatimonadota bacterium]
MSADVGGSDLFMLFLEEAQEQLVKLDEGLLHLEKDPGNIEVIKEVFRAAHTLKGSSATMGFMEISDLTHAMENVLDRLRSGQLAAGSEVVDLLLEATDALRELVAQVSQGQQVNLDTKDLLSRLKSLSTEEKPLHVTGEIRTSRKSRREKSVKRKQATYVNTSGNLLLRIKISDTCLMPSVRAFMIFHVLSDFGKVVSSDISQEKIDEAYAGQEITVVLDSDQDTEAVVNAIKNLSEVELVDCSLEEGFDVDDESSKDSSQREAYPVEQTKEDLDKQPSEANRNVSTSSSAIQTVRVGVDRLDKLMNLVAELVIDRTRMTQIASDLAFKYDDELVHDLNETGAHIGRVVNELQEHIMKIRLLPVEQVFNRFPRMVRDLARKAGKDVEFVLEGQETELDRSILEAIVDPITHLLRNAIDHGVETPEERRAAGKPSQARVVLAAKQEENRIIIEVQDDGRGISIEKVKSAALKRGVIDESALSRMSDDDALQLIFASGVSTADKITDISGRGVGMDVVRNNIQSLSGTVEVHTDPGKGTTFRMNLPLTLAIIQSLLTSVDNRVYVIPLSGVVETFRCRSD